MSNSPDMPWLVQAWQTLQHRLDGGKLPHAWLVTAEAGVNKHAWADHAAHMLVCGQSRSLWSVPAVPVGGGGSHPDIGPMVRKPFAVIKVSNPGTDRLRHDIAPESSQGVIIDRADQLNPSAANALLKTLEEPPEDLVLILLQESSRPILPTIRSRCRVTLRTPGPVGPKRGCRRLHPVLSGQ